MNVNPNWNMQETREVIADLYGKDQMLLARESLNSVIDRRDFAHFHFHEAMDRWEQYLIDIKAQLLLIHLLELGGVQEDLFLNK